MVWRERIRPDSRAPDDTFSHSQLHSLLSIASMYSVLAKNGPRNALSSLLEALQAYKILRLSVRSVCTPARSSSPSLHVNLVRERNLTICASVTLPYGLIPGLLGANFVCLQFWNHFNRPFTASALHSMPRNPSLPEQINLLYHNICIGAQNFALEMPEPLMAPTFSSSFHLIACFGHCMRSKRRVCAQKRLPSMIGAYFVADTSVNVIVERQT